MNEEKHSYNQEMISRIKRLRQDMDLTLKTMAHIQGKLSANEGLREWALVITNMQQSRLWTGAALEKLGLELPEEYADKYQKEL